MSTITSITVCPRADVATAIRAMTKIAFLADSAPSFLPSQCGIAPSSAIAARRRLATTVFPTRLVNSAPPSASPSAAVPAPPSVPLTRSKARAFASPDEAIAADHPASPPPDASTGISSAATYAATAATMAATIIPKDLRTGKLNSADMQEMDSIPTKSHGVIIRTPSIWETGEPPFGEKNGCIEATPPTCPNAAAQKQTTSPTASATARTD